jgi:hypothetical protein
MKLVKVILITAILGSSKAYSTSQIPDIIVMDGETYPLNELPL